MGIILTPLQMQHRPHRIQTVKTVILVTKHEKITPHLIIIRATLEEKK